MLFANLFGLSETQFLIIFAKMEYLRQLNEDAVLPEMLQAMLTVTVGYM